MVNIYLKQWIVAGALSGGVIGFSLTLMLYFGFPSLISELVTLSGYFPFFLLFALTSYILLGSFAGVIVSLMCNKFLVEKNLLKFLLLSIIVITITEIGIFWGISVIISYYFPIFLSFSFILIIPFQFTMTIGLLFSTTSIIIFGIGFVLALILEGIVFGFLINHIKRRIV